MSVDPSAVTAAEPTAGGVTPAPRTIGKYRLDRVLGVGGMGIVWAAFDQDLERAVALKLLHGETEGPTLRSRLLREAQAMARLRHPHVVTVFDIGTDAGRDFIAMELVEGSTLEAWLDTRPPPRAIAEALIAAGRGLAAAHAAGLVHRDFKPHNVLRGTDGHIYVTDFGLARGLVEAGSALVPGVVPPAPAAAELTPRRARDSVLDSPLTQTGVMIGTPAYMAPEQFAGHVPDPRSDQFAFCVTAWEALTGARPFRGSTLEELEGAVAAGPRGLTSSLPPAVHAVLVRGLEADPAARWPDMLALLTALDEALAAPRPPRRRARALVLGALVLGLAGGISTFAWMRARGGEACPAADEVFASAWGPARRAQLRGAHRGGMAIGALVLLDRVEDAWKRAYTATCTGHPSADARQRRSCLLAAREHVRHAVDAALVPGADLDMVELATAAARVELCTGGEGIRDLTGLGAPPPPPLPP